MWKRWGLEFRGKEGWKDGGSKRTRKEKKVKAQWQGERERIEDGSQGKWWCSILLPGSTCGALIGGLLGYRVTGWHQVAVGEQGTSANETDMKSWRVKRRERADKEGGIVLEKCGKGRKHWARNNLASGGKGNGKQLSIASAVDFKTRAAFCGLALLLLAKPSRSTNGGKEETVKCGLVSEIKRVLIFKPIARSSAIAMQPFPHVEDIPNLRASEASCISVAP